MRLLLWFLMKKEKKKGLPRYLFANGFSEITSLSLSLSLSLSELDSMEHKVENKIFISNLSSHKHQLIMRVIPKDRLDASCLAARKTQNLQLAYVI